MLTNAVKNQRPMLVGAQKVLCSVSVPPSSQRKMLEEILKEKKKSF
jgi:hypothetical protein